MTIIAAFLANAGLNFALGLLVARFLGPDEFGRYAVAMAVAVVINTAFFEWLRLSTTRFYSDERHSSEPGLRATIELGYAAVSLSAPSSARRGQPTSSSACRRRSLRPQRPPG